MSLFSISDNKTEPQSKKLSDWETAVIDLFLNAVQSLGLPKSLGQIYGLLFCRDYPLAMDEVMKLLGISKGSASQGLRSLRQLGAISSFYAPGDRKERFSAEIRLRKLVGGFLREQAEPHMEKGIARLEGLREILSHENDEVSKECGQRRERILSGWHKQLSRVLPLVKLMIGKTERISRSKS